MEIKECRKGTKAIYDAFTHLVPVVVTEVVTPGNGWVVCEGELEVRVEKTTGPYKKGEVFYTTPFHTPPTSHIRRTEYNTMIKNNYKWVK